MDLSVTPRGLLRILADLQLRLSPRPAGLPVLTRCSFALIPSPIPRWHRILLALLASHPAFGLRLKITDSASTLPFSRLARCSFSLWSMCSLIPPCGTFCIEGLVPCRCQQATLRLLPAGATVAGWAFFLPLDQRALFTAHDFRGLVSCPRNKHAFRRRTISAESAPQGGFHIKPRIEGFLQIGYPCVALSALAPLFAFT